MRYPHPRLASTAALAALLLAACGGAEEPRPSEDAAPLVSTLATAPSGGAERLRAGEVAAARASFEAALDASPDQLGALNDLAVSYLVEGHPDAARRLLDEVVSTGSPPEQQAALVNLGELYALEGYLPAAQAHLETARDIDPARPGPWYALAILADARGDLPGARAALREALRLDADGAARAGFAYVYAEERVHLEALIAEQAGDPAGAAARWRELSQGRFPVLAGAAQRHLAGE
ncbi:tetratricopeptide repeat protein [Anaeromyxobacter dehalogenans]|uniref:tetratricopeptide repeat protein n=1 Tax=Anaeromyxobacter dehalogenans TaxID=161493 RepID=UPI00059BF9A1|nr:tetratricopeptide repeat protein [Anaeromyxobacter dehalogenans]